MGERWGKQVELFLSTYVNKVDRKGRVSVPATFRSTLATNSQPNLLVAFPSLRVRAVECAGSNRIEEMQRRIDTLEQFSDEYENLTQIFADSHPMSMDPEGRVILPEALKEHAGIGCDVAFVGLGAMFQLWNPALYEEHRAAVRERSRQQRTTLPPHSGAVRHAAGGDP
jgi:transcriptional regulator MraZ